MAGSTKSTSRKTPAAKGKKKTRKIVEVITKSYKLRQILHAAKHDASKTLCGRAIDRKSEREFEPVDIKDAEDARVCRKCLRVIAVMDRAHEGWE